MKVDIVRNGTVVKSFDTWKEQKRPESFSIQLLKELRDNRNNVDIRNVRELLMLGADPNYKLMGHTSEEEMQKIIDYYEENEMDDAPKMEVITWCTLAQAISLQSTNPEIVESMFDYKHKANPNLNLSDVNISRDPSAFFFCARKKAKDLKSHERIIDLFVNHGANINITNQHGDNVIHRCVWAENYDIIPKLIEIGVDPYKKNNDGMTPYDLASRTSYYAGSYKRIEDTPEKLKTMEILKPKEEPKSKKSFFSKR